MAAVRERVGDDVATLKRDVGDQGNEALGQLKGLLDIGEQARAHPLSAVAGGLGLGVLLGVASDSISAGNGRAKGRGDGSHNGAYEAVARPQNNNGSSEGAFNGLLSGVLSMAAGTLQDELRELIREGFASLKDGVRGEPRASNAAQPRASTAA
jgi:hypothetical protein